MRPLLSSRRLVADCRGASVIEFAFIAPIIAILVIGVIDFGLALWNDMQVADAAQAGAAYAAVHGWTTTTGDVETAVSSATQLTLTTDTANIINCGSSPSIGPCASGGSGNYWEVAAGLSYSTILPWPGISRPMPLAYTAYAKLYP